LNSTRFPAHLGREAGAVRPNGMRLLTLFLLTSALAAQPTALDAQAVGGPIKAWVVHVDERLMEQFGPAHRDLVAAVPPGVRVFVGVANADAEPAIRADLDPDEKLGSSLKFLPVDGEITAWARDRYLVVGDRMLLSNYYHDAFAWPADRRIGELFAKRMLTKKPVQSHLFFEGGDIVLGAEHAFIGYDTILENAQANRIDEGTAARELGEMLGRKVVVLGTDTGPPHEHCDMYVSVVGARRLLVGDPRLSLVAMPKEGGYSEESHRLRAAAFDRVAADLRQAGFRVERIPLLIGDDGNFRTWNNAVTETRADGFHVYLPRYGVGALDRLAQAVWKRCGFRVHPISCAGSIVHGGAIRCLTHTVRGAIPELGRPASVGALEPARR